MQTLVTEKKGPLLILSFNRPKQHNAFDDQLLQELQTQLDDAAQQPDVRVLILKGLGPDFSAGADLGWMKRMAQMSEEENRLDALRFARVMATLYHCPKPTIAMVHGRAIGGGVGLIAACDIAIASVEAQFSFPEVRLGLIPAVISPYVIQAIGERAARWLFLSTTPIDAQRAYELQLIHHGVPHETLLSSTLTLAEQIANHAPEALTQTKQLMDQLRHHPLDTALQHLTAEWIAKRRVSTEAQERMHAFLSRNTPSVSRSASDV